MIKKLLQEQTLAKELLIAMCYVGSQNCMPSADVAVRLAKVLNTTVEYLVTGSNPELPQTHDIKLQEIYSKLKHFSDKDLDAVQHIVDALNEKY